MVSEMQVLEKRRARDWGAISQRMQEILTTRETLHYDEINKIIADKGDELQSLRNMIASAAKTIEGIEMEQKERIRRTRAEYAESRDIIIGTMSNARHFIDEAMDSTRLEYGIFVRKMVDYLLDPTTQATQFKILTTGKRKIEDTDDDQESESYSMTRSSRGRRGDNSTARDTGARGSTEEMPKATT